MPPTVSPEGAVQLNLTALPPLAARVLLRDARGEVSLRQEGNGSYRGEGAWVDVSVRAVPQGQCVTLRLRLESAREVAAIGLEMGPLGLTERHKFFGTTPGFLEKQGVAPATVVQSEQRVATLLGVLVFPDSSGLLAGLGALNDHPTSFSLVEDRLRACFLPDRTLSGETAFTFFIAGGPQPLELLQDYGRFLAPLGRCAATTPTGWNTWDFYGGAIRMADVEAEMEALRQFKCRKALQYCVVDMGWEENWGDWTPNRNFPEKLESIAGRIRAAGWRPGIWTAPFQVSMFTPLARHRPELFLRNAEGGLIIEQDSPRGPVLLFDFSLPETRALVGGWFAAMRRAGFELFKVDYLYDLYLRQSRHSAGGLGKIAFAREMFRTIREAVGPDAHIVNCGGNKEAVLGLVDSSRVTVDIHNFWGHIRNNARQLAHTFWMNRRLWINDPDFAIVRHAGTCSAAHKNMPYTRRPLTDEKEFWMRGLEASGEEMRVWLSAVRLNGGSLFLSDSFRTLAAEGRAELARLFPPLETPFVPLDLFERDRPGIWHAPDAQRPTLGLFNWEDAPQSLTLPAPLDGQIEARDFWTGERLLLKGSLELPARSGRLLELPPAGR